ncbi:stress response protein SCP2 [Streptomyces nodosus]|uniref:Export associated protein n=1 Tax=Streptomyces nodosus TaxID=40318 RepID=A0A5P2VYR5_9ACTN|nr:TerD family protein [Streptomyces nodosus]MBB4791198.1 stress response protein SCP2 [Streptomyces nodosus]QEV38764.1 export associated protein [Streptomyces nodosus]
MAAELVRGQNHPLPQSRLEVRVSAGRPVVAGAALGDAQGKVSGSEWVAHPGAPTLPGLEVSRQAAAEHRLAFDLDALPPGVQRVSVLLALPPGIGGPVRFGAVAAPWIAVTGLDGQEIAHYTITGLDSESAVIALELYRRQGAWKVRAVGQGYAGGLADLFQDQGLPEARRLADGINEAVARGLARSVAPPPPRLPEGDRTRQMPAPAAPGATGGVPPRQDSPGAPQQGSPYDAPGPTGSAVPPVSGGAIDYTHPRRGTPAPPPPAAPAAPPGQPAQPVAGDATGWSMDERLYNQVWGMFEDLARTTAAYRSAVDFAEARLEQELDTVLSDPRNRVSGPGDAARAAAETKHTDLVDQARAALDRDLTQLVAESDVVEPALPPAFARWDNPVWHGYRVPMEIPMAVRLGDLRLPESENLRIPMLVRLPLERGLWIDSGRPGSPDALVEPDEPRRLAMETAVTHAARLLAVYPPGEFAVQVIDPAGAGAAALAPLVRSGVLAAPPAAGAAGTAEMLAALTRRVDLVQMALRGGASDALPPGFDTAAQLLIVHDFPHGFDDRAVNQLRYLADEGPAVGVHLMMVADREDATAYGPLLDPLWRRLLRLTPTPDDHLADPWVGHAWTYEPPRVPEGSQVLSQVLTRVAEARRAWNR